MSSLRTGRQARSHQKHFFKQLSQTERKSLASMQPANKRLNFTGNANIKWGQHSAALPHTPKFTSELRRPAHTSMVTRSIFFFVGLIEDASVYPEYEIRCWAGWIVHSRLPEKYGGERWGARALLCVYSYI